MELLTLAYSMIDLIFEFLGPLVWLEWEREEELLDDDSDPPEDSEPYSLLTSLL